MKRLNIALVSQGRAFERLVDLLQDQGHAAALYTTCTHVPPASDILVEDGSVPVPDDDPSSLPHIPRLGVYVTVSDTPLNIAVDISYRGGVIEPTRLIARRLVQPDLPTGNGQQLRLETLQVVEALVALQIARYARNPLDLHEAAALAASSPGKTRTLAWLEHLAFVHAFNETVHAGWLDAASHDRLSTLVPGLLAFADCPALTLDGQRWSYRHLHALTQTLAQALVPHWPVDGEQVPVVGVCLHKSPALYASLLAILHSGAIYLPIDPATPLARREHILRDAGACLVLHDDQPPTGIASLDVRELPVRPDEARPASGTVPSWAPDRPCVAIYTSGTTGQPKGVLLSRRNLTHFMSWYIDQVALDAHSRALQFSTIGFDASLLDSLPALFVGAELVVPSEPQRQDPHALSALIRHEAVTHAFLPPALLSVLPSEPPLGLQHLVTGGDVCEPHVIARLAPQCPLHNIYGPTETTVLATMRVFGIGDDTRNVGRPIANTQVLILDEALQPVGDQVPGELYIAGAGVGLGYVNNPDLTAERFRHLPLPSGDTVHVYRTGDIAQWTSDGIVLCGRRDHQVKIRGFRVEPEEIEHCLRRSQAYGQVAVVIDAQHRILAFVAQPRDAQADDTLRDHARRHLPAYMVPTFYYPLEALPSTANGKVDRQALLRSQPTPVARPRLAPQTPTEQRLVELWSELLERPDTDLSMDDSFFEIGGHSILLSRLLLAVRERFGRGVAINQFIEQPTLRRLGALLDGTGDAVQGLAERLERDALRPLELEVQPLERMGDVHRVIVTGANSFLGVHLVEALLDWGSSEVACLVRRGEGRSAQVRFAQAVADNRLTLDMTRVRVFEADLRQPRLGLSEADYRYLDEHFGALVHNAAQVNHVLDYPALAQDNVEPLFECLRLCEGARKKVFNFISTLSACSAVDAHGRVLEREAVATPPVYLRNGYNLSKWVGERILARARAEGVRVNLFRPGNITFDSRSGVSQPERNRLMLMLKGSLQLGQVPRLHIDFDLMPVDFLARFVAFHASRHHAEACVFNLHNPEPLRWEDYLASFRAHGHVFDLVSTAQWQEQLRRVDRDNALFDVLGFYLDGFGEDIGDISSIDHPNARNGVQRMGTRYPAKTPALLQRGCQYLSDIGFI
ncbi:non-ribosomal peptide synthetase [Pseudomonas entomophila]|uniref:amino acid adenylation domain-containing protein n=1 Tax=Pseudomonas entomophila TaxID=312306 RepID=UPI0015E41F31|nr:amino acid adenylation domain-containing protein [Pseudomonas entomophila]MBA1190924.1 non-ribosomal peptide synthetase [Pseudomonas entomophila]